MNLEIRSGIGNSPRTQREISEIVADAYWEQISLLCDDKDKMTAAMLGAYHTEYFYVAYDGDTAVGVAACCPPGRRAVTVNPEQICRVLGGELGQVAAEIMKNEFEHPHDFGPDSAYIEFVATAKATQGKGVATAITKHIIEDVPYRRLVLEVADTNTTAISLYIKLGFSEFMRTPEPNSVDNGVNYRIYMEYIMDARL